MKTIRVLCIILFAWPVLTFAAEPLTLTGLVPVGADEWVGWTEDRHVYTLREGQPAQLWKQVYYAPVAAARGVRGVVLAGEGGFAFRPYGPDPRIVEWGLIGSWRSVAATTAGYVASDNYELMAFSRDGANWQKIDAPMLGEDKGSLIALAAGDGRFVALVDRVVDGGGMPWRAVDVWTSTDGRTWKQAYYGEHTLERRAVETLAYHNKRWVALSDWNALVSDDGENWQAMADSDMDYATPPPVNVYTLKFGGGRWWALDWGDKAASSDGGVDWSGSTVLNLDEFNAEPGRWVIGHEGLQRAMIGNDGVLTLSTIEELQTRAEARRVAAKAEADRVAQAKAEQAAKAAREADLKRRMSDLAYALLRPRGAELPQHWFLSTWTEAEQRVVEASTTEGFFEKLGVLVDRFPKGSSKEQVALKAAVKAAADELVRAYGGARGTFKYMMKIDSGHLNEFRNRLTTAQQAFIKEQAQAVTGAKALPPNWAGDKAWASGGRGERGPQQHNDFDMATARRRLLDGKFGAAADIYSMYQQADGAPRDSLLALFWMQVYTRLVPGGNDPKNGNAVAAAAGSGKAALFMAQSHWVEGGTGTNTFDQEGWKWRRLAAEAGSFSSAILIATYDAAVHANAQTQADIANYIGVPPADWEARLNRQRPASEKQTAVTVSTKSGKPAAPAASGPRRPAFNVVFPAPGKNWTEAQIARLRPILDQRRALSGELFELQAIAEDEAEVKDEMVEIRDHYAAIWDEPLPKEFQDAYIASCLSLALLYHAGDDFTTGTPQKFTQMVEAALGVDGTNPKLWLIHAQLQAWTGKIDNARRALWMAGLLAQSVPTTESFLHEGITRMRAELALPPEVRGLSHGHVIEINRNGLMQKSLLGGEYSEQQNSEAATLYANLGVRLAAAWGRPDAKAVVPLVYQAHATLLTSVRFPPALLDQIQSEFERIKELSRTDPKAALVQIEALAKQAPLAAVIAERASLLIKLEQWEAARLDVEGALLLDPRNKFATLLRERLAMQETSSSRAKAAEAQRRHAAWINEAQAAFRAGNDALGKQRVNEVLAEDPENHDGLRLLTLWQAGVDPAASLATAKRFAQAHPQSDQAAALLVGQWVAAKQMTEAMQLATQARKNFPQSAAVEAAEAMAKLAEAMTTNSPNVRQIVTDRLQRLNHKAVTNPQEPLVFSVRAQLRMMTGDRAGAMDDMIRFVELSDHVPPMLLHQIAATLQQAGRESDAQAVLNRLPQ